MKLHSLLRGDKERGIAREGPMHIADRLFGESRSEFFEAWNKHLGSGTQPFRRRDFENSQFLSASARRVNAGIYPGPEPTCQK